MSVTIVRIASRGDGVASDGSFHSGTAPGDLVLPDGEIVPGPHRVKPPCRHFSTCGGCQLQHIDSHSYSAFLAGRIEAALASQGLSCAEIRQPHVSPPRSRRRVALAAEKKGRAMRIGFSERASHRLVDLQQCEILHPSLLALLAPLRRLLPEFAGTRRLAIRMALADQGVDLLLAGIEAAGPEANERLVRFARENGLARVSVDEGFGPFPRWEPEPVTITLSGHPVALPEGAFLQATADGEATLVSSVREALTGAERVADLFAGLGTFALAMDARVHAVEGSRDAVLALGQVAKRAGGGVSVEHRDLFRKPLAASEAARFAAVILDPPRAGALEQVRELASSGVARIAYVSCNPATFARDAKILVQGGFALCWIQPVGQFLWSTHVELAACFERTG